MEGEGTHGSKGTWENLISYKYEKCGEQDCRESRYGAGGEGGKSGL